MEFRLLGPVEAVRDGRSLALGGAKPRALLALLLLHANEVVSRDRLIEALWPRPAAGHGGAQPRRPGLAAAEGVRAGRAAADAERRLRPRGRPRADRRASVRAACSRRAKGERRGRARRGARGARRRRSRSGAGDALADLAYEEFARAEIERLEELRLVAIEERIDAELALGRSRRAHRRARGARRRSTRCASGCADSSCSRSTAPGGRPRRCASYADTRRRLVEELGIEPGTALQRARAGDPPPGSGARSPAAARRDPAASGARRRTRARARRRRRRGRRGADPGRDRDRARALADAGLERLRSATSSGEFVARGPRARHASRCASAQARCGASRRRAS